MFRKTCFVMTAIGDQEFAGTKVTASELRARYDHLIKEALQRAAPGLEITRADEVQVAGTITTDIMTRIMHSDLVVADVTYPNANVFYELGLRHACRPGTIIIRDKHGPRPPFDISHLRYIEYENTPSGVKSLETNFTRFLEQLAKDPQRPDNHFLELAKLTHYEYPQFQDAVMASPEVALMQAAFANPELLSLGIRASAGEPVPPEAFVQAMQKDPDSTLTLIKSLVASGTFSFSNSSSAKNAAPTSAKRRGVKRRTGKKRN